MRLMNAKSKRLHEFFDNSIPPFAILSHVWATEEVTYADVQARWPWYRRKAGYAKIKGCCRQALDDDIEYVWIDSCCIDKASSAELSEAINSMFAWYRDAVVCYAYLADVPGVGDVLGDGSAFRRSRWFRRGWTLQELLAPGMVRFFDRRWRPLGTKSALWAVVQDVTGIGSEYLWGTNLDRASVAQRMSWAAKRETTRREDRAYCLLGLFGVHMPLLYGEGDRAFVRLQEEIIRSSGDHSVLAWGFDMSVNECPNGGILAQSPSDFVHCGAVIADRWPANLRSSHFVTTNMGLRIELPIGIEEFTGTPIAILNCTTEKQYLALPLASVEGSEDKFERLPFSQPTVVAPRIIGSLSLKEFYLQNPSTPMWNQSVFIICTLVLHQLGFHLKTVYPPQAISKITFRGDAIEYVWVYQGSHTMLELQSPKGEVFTIGIHDTGNDSPGIRYRLARSPLANMINVRRAARKSEASSSCAFPKSFPLSLSEEPAQWTQNLMVGQLEISACITEEIGVHGTSSTQVIEMLARSPAPATGKPLPAPPLPVTEDTASDSSGETHLSFSPGTDIHPSEIEDAPIMPSTPGPQEDVQVSPSASEGGDNQPEVEL